MTLQERGQVPPALPHLPAGHDLHHHRPLPTRDHQRPAARDPQRYQVQHGEERPGGLLQLYQLCRGRSHTPSFKSIISRTVNNVPITIVQIFSENRGLLPFLWS